MRFTSSLVAMGSLASTAIAASKADFVFPDSVPMHKRQTEGPKYECHTDCGAVISGARQDDYCENKDWLALLEDCLDCAEEQDIWMYYGNSVSSAAEACGLDATPKPAGGDDDASSSATGTASSAESQPTVAEEESSNAEESSAAGETASTAEASEATSAVTATTVASTSPTAGTNGTATPTSVPDSGASQLWGSHVVVGAAAILMAANLM